MSVTNNSYFADPWEYNCRNDAGQRAIWEAERRAIRFAQTRGVTVVAAAGNDSDDLSRPTTDETSPDDTTLPTTPDDYLGITGVNSGAVQQSQGGPGHNSWYGSGQIDALNAVD